MQHLGRVEDAVLGGGLRVGEAVVAAAHVVLERHAPIGQGERLLHVVQERLLRVAAEREKRWCLMRQLFTGVVTFEIF